VLELCGQSIIHGKELLLTALPLYHIFSFMMNFLTFWFAGANSVLCPSPRPIKNLQVIFKNYKITWMSGVNTLFNSLLGEKWFHQKPPKKLKFAVAGGMSLHSSVAERWERTSRSQIAEGYGLSECSPVLAFNPLGQRVKRDSIGVPLPSTDLLIVDDKGRALPAGKEGELLARGPQVMKGYWNNPSETKKVFVNGWFKTGDMAVMDVDGYFKIVDRKKDMIVVSGFKVFPNEVEECLTRHPGVAEAAVIGVPDAHSGEVPKAFVVLKDPKVTPAMLIAHCKSSLASYKIPHQFEFRTDLPKSTIGKILRKNLRTGNVPLVKPVAVRVVKKKKAVAHKK
jgi:long-chain acyl-CoA synthetase